MKKSSMFFLWVGASISISEIFTGGLLAPLGFVQGIGVILGGHLIGTILFAAGAYISYTRKVNAMESAAFSFGSLGGKLVAMCNLVQLVGWIIILVVQSANAIVGALPNLPFWTVALVLSILQMVWTIVFSTPGGRINDAAVILLAGLCGLFFFEAFSNKTTAVNSVQDINLALGIELCIAMPVSWLPLVGDHSYKANNKICAVLMPFLGYFLGSSLMYIIGFYIVISSGNDIFSFIGLSKFRYIACGVLMLSTMTTNFVALYSAAVSSTQFTKSNNTQIPAGVIGTAALVVAVFFPVDRFVIVLEKFLTSITMVFAPLFTILFIECLTKKKQCEKAVNWRLLLIAVIGMAGNWLFNRYAIFIPTLASVALVAALYAVPIKFTRG
ncbi:MAG: permease [Treponema sp.]|jgi:putative hydroxymethylpyrimidine transporter CytX|nr:permease [Treponema sp.]